MENEVKPADKLADDGVTQIKLIEHNEITTPEELKITETTSNSEVRRIPDLNEIVEDMPIILPIEFEGGTNEIKRKDKDYLDHLYNTLLKNSTVSGAHSWSCMLWK